jgi:hypothetical protein
MSRLRDRRQERQHGDNDHDDDLRNLHHGRKNADDCKPMASGPAALWITQPACGQRRYSTEADRSNRSLRECLR